MSNFMNDPLGAMSQVNTAIKTKVNKAAENIKNNEKLKESLKNAKEKSYNAAHSLKENANYAYEHRAEYKDQMYQGVSHAAEKAKTKAGYRRGDPNDPHDQDHELSTAGQQFNNNWEFVEEADALNRQNSKGDFPLSTADFNNNPLSANYNPLASTPQSTFNPLSNQNQ